MQANGAGGADWPDADAWADDGPAAGRHAGGKSSWGDEWGDDAEALGGPADDGRRGAVGHDDLGWGPDLPVGEPGPGGRDWGHRPAPEPGGEVVQPPAALLVGAVALPVLALLLLRVGSPVVHVVGWAVAVFGSLGLVLAFTARDLRLSANAWYGGTPGYAPALRLVAVVLGIAVAATHAWFFADWASRLDAFAG